MKARRQQCTARISNGSRQCQKWAILGGSVCRKHGGAAPQVQRSAAERLQALVDPAISGLAHVLKEGKRKGDLAATTRAAVAILDRTGFAPQVATDAMKRIEDPDTVLCRVLGIEIGQLPSADDDREKIDLSLLSVETLRKILEESAAIAEDLTGTVRLS